MSIKSTNILTIEESILDSAISACECFLRLKSTGSEDVEKKMRKTDSKFPKKKLFSPTKIKMIKEKPLFHRTNIVSPGPQLVSTVPYVTAATDSDISVSPNTYGLNDNEWQLILLKSYALATIIQNDNLQNNDNNRNKSDNNNNDDDDDINYHLNTIILNSIINYDIYSSQFLLLPTKSMKSIFLLNKLRLIRNQFSIDGFQNIWIVKAPDVSRGLGMQLLYKLNEILECEKNLSCRTVQKYIENPLLDNQLNYSFRNMNSNNDFTLNDNMNHIYDYNNFSNNNDHTNNSSKKNRKNVLNHKNENMKNFKLISEGLKKSFKNRFLERLSEINFKNNFINGARNSNYDIYGNKINNSYDENDNENKYNNNSNNMNDSINYSNDNDHDNSNVSCNSRKELSQKSVNSSEKSFTHTVTQKNKNTSKIKEIELQNTLKNTNNNQNFNFNFNSRDFLKQSINRDQVKFDLRVWVLVTSFEPGDLKAFIYTAVYGRRCSVPYTSNVQSLNETLGHLTNYSLQKKSIPLSMTDDKVEAYGNPISAVRSLRNMTGKANIRKIKVKVEKSMNMDEWINKSEKSTASTTSFSSSSCKIRGSSNEFLKLSLKQSQKRPGSAYHISTSKSTSFPTLTTTNHELSSNSRLDPGSDLLICKFKLCDEMISYFSVK